MISPDAHGLGANDKASAIPEVASALKITPANTSTNGLAAAPASANSIAMPTTPPATALSGNVHTYKPATWKYMLSTAPNAAMADTPNTPGSASGLRR